MILKLLVFALAALVLLTGCVTIKPGSATLTQPGGIGVAHVRAVLCTEGGEACGPPSKSSEQQLLLGLVVPVGSSVPTEFTATPIVGSAGLTFTRSEQTGQALAANGANGAETPTLVPAGFELVGYLSSAYGEVAGQLLEWQVDIEAGLPAAADGGSYGGPLSAKLVLGSREVTPALVPTRPVACITGQEFSEEFAAEEERIEGKEVPAKVDPAKAWCNAPLAENELTLGVSEMKLAPPQTAVATPGATAKLPFGLDFASTASPPPTFTLGATSTLSGAQLRMSNGVFGRAPSSTPPNRAPPTTRKAVVSVPKTALPGTYEVTMTATAAQGGAVSSTATLRIKPKGKLTVKVPKKIAARQASRRGIPVKVNTRTARTKVVARLLGPKPNGRGKRQLAKRRARSKEPGNLGVRLKLGKRFAEALAADRAKLRAEVKVFEPKKKRRRFVRVVRLK